MIKSIRSKFLLLLIVVATVGLSAAFLLRELMVSDFREYLEGETIDRAFSVTAALESSYERNGGWNRDDVIQHTVWASMLGMRIRLFDLDGEPVMDSETAIGTLPPLAKKRVMAIQRASNRQVSFFTPYVLFLGGNEIGRLEVDVIDPHRERIFVMRSNRFLIFSILVLGGVAIVLGLVFSRRMTQPLKALTTAASAIQDGNLKSRVTTTGTDEIGTLAESFNRMAKSLETQDALRKKISSTVAHELRTPISALRGELEGLMDGLIPPDKETIQSLYDEIGRLKGLIDGMEEVSQAEASSLTLRKQDLKLLPFLQNIVERFKRSFREKGVRTGLICDQKLVAHADPDKLSQIVINLLSNALNATAPGDEVMITAGRDNKNIILEVTDTGSGIRKTDIPFIFERFYRVSEGGLGIGLTIVKELVDAHGGKIEVESTHGKGSKFRLMLPF